MKPIDKDQLEQLIDTHGLPELLEQMAQIAFEKSEHIQSNWQDRGLSQAWSRSGAKLEKVASNIGAILPATA